MHGNSKYSENIADIICERLVEGQSMRTICQDPDMPDRATVLRWLHLHEDFAAKYARARELQGDYYAEETIHIVDEEEDPNRGRVRMQARQWYAAKLAPKKYGDKLGLTDGEGGPLQVVINRFGKDNPTE